MSQRLTSATEWAAAKSALNTLISNCNAVFYYTASYNSISPSAAGPLSDSPATAVSRSVSGGDQLKADEYADADGLVTKYNYMRKYASCYRYKSNASYEYGLTVVSEGIAGYRDPSFPATSPASLTPPAGGELNKDVAGTSGRDILEIIVAGCAVHQSTLFGFAPGSEYVYINECHSACHSACHSSCHRNRR